MSANSPGGGIPGASRPKQKAVVNPTCIGRHLLSHCEGVIRIHVYATILACLLIALWTGRKAQLRAIEVLWSYLAGWATEQELEAHLAKLKEQKPPKKRGE